jgi:hypothetical protein
MIIQMTCYRELILADVSVRIDTPHPKASVCGQPISCEIEIAAD